MNVTNRSETQALWQFANSMYVPYKKNLSGFTDDLQELQCKLFLKFRIKTERNFVYSKTNLKDYAERYVID